jgi:hypothetical protein
VSLTEVVRGAAAETEDFARVKAAKLPARKVIGPVVGDLVHLLAELIDNATSFSPPGSRVEVRGNIVGRGVVLEIEDQGLGIEADRVDDLNNMLANPPDFGIMALSAEPRLGLFVVARLAARHGIGVSLRESAYGGTRAIVLVRNELLGPDAETTPDEDVKQLSPETPAERTDTHLPVVGGPDVPIKTLKLSIPGAVNLPDLPPLPMVEARPGEDLFRPQRPVDAEHELSLPVRRPQKPEAPRPQEPTEPTEAPEPVAESLQPAPLPEAAPPALPVVPELTQPAPLDADTRQFPPANVQQPPQFAQATGRPPLPQRRRQQNLAPQLREEPAPTWPQPQPNPEHNRDDTPDQARSRLAAFQAGTRRGRHEQVSEETVNGRSAGNGQHRSE